MCTTGDGVISYFCSITAQKGQGSGVALPRRICRIRMIWQDGKRPSMNAVALLLIVLTIDTGALALSPRSSANLLPGIINRYQVYVYWPNWYPVPGTVWDRCPPKNTRVGVLGTAGDGQHILLLQLTAAVELVADGLDYLCGTIIKSRMFTVITPHTTQQSTHTALCSVLAASCSCL